MSINYQQTIAGWCPTTFVNPAPSGSFSPIAAGDALIVVGADVEAGTYTMSLTGTGTYSSNGSADAGGDSWIVGSNLSCSSGSQTITVHSSGPSTDQVFGAAVEYSGVASVGSVVVTGVNAPGTGAGAIAGSPVTVPSGSYLLAFCLDNDSTTNTPATLGTSRGTGSIYATGAYCWGEWAGAGSSVTPEFTAASGGGSDFYFVAQFVLTPAVSFTPHPVKSNGKALISNGKVVMGLAPIAWMIDRRNKLASQYVQDRKTRIFLPSWLKRR